MNIRTLPDNIRPIMIYWPINSLINSVSLVVYQEVLIVISGGSRYAGYPVAGVNGRGYAMARSRSINYSHCAVFLRDIVQGSNSAARAQGYAGAASARADGIRTTLSRCFQAVDRIYGYS